MAPEGRKGSQQHKRVYMYSYRKIFLGPRGLGRAAVRETILKCVYKGNIFKRSSQEPIGPKSLNLHKSIQA
jgi:selenocysteine lyase/cysteine desulfurase